MFRKLWRRWTAIKDPWGIDRDFYASIGIVAAEWSRVEHLLGVLIFLGAGVQSGQGDFLISNLGFQSRVQLLNAEIEIFEKIDVPADKISEVRSIIKELNELYPKRNYYVHAFYTGGSGEIDAESHVVRIKGRIRDLSRTVTAFEVMETYARIWW